MRYRKVDEGLSKLRVGIVYGCLPADVAHLEVAGQEVELTMYHSDWAYPRWGTSAPNPPAGVTVRPFRPAIRTGRGHLTFYFPGLHRALVRDQPDVLHVVSEPWGLLATQAARWARSQPNAKLVIHGCDTIWHHGSSVKQRVRRLILPYVLGRTDAFVGENSLAVGVARDNGLPSGSSTARIHTNPRDSLLFRPPDPEQRESARAALGLAPGVLAVGLLGRLVPEKGVLVLLAAAEALLEAGFPIRVFVAGEGPLRDEVVRRASQGVIPLGKLPYPTGVLDLLWALDVLACPSIPTALWEDQGPRVLLEAMMCGCVPVGTRTGGIPEMLDGHGVLTDPEDVDGLIAALRAAAVLAGDESQRMKLSDWARATYSDRALGHRMVKLWRGLATQPPIRTAPGPRTGHSRPPTASRGLTTGEHRGRH